jgi:hypothetical protein
MTSTATTPTTTTTTTTAPPPDLVEPEVSLTAPANGSALAIATPDFAGIAGVETGDDDVVELLVERDAVPVDGYPVSVAVDNGAWAFTPTIALADGLYTAVVSQHDAAGNTGASSPTSFTVDTTPPTLSLKCPSSLAATVTCTLTLDESGTAHVEVYEILSDGKTERQLDTLGSIDLQADTPKSLKLDLGNVSGIAVRIIAGAHDTAGNEAEAQTARLAPPPPRLG